MLSIRFSRQPNNFNKDYMPVNNYATDTALAASNGASLVGFSNGLTAQDMLNLQNDEVIQGREYATPFHAKLFAGANINITMSGDSTTNGDFATTPFRIWEILPNLLRERGVGFGLTCNNAGHSGAGTGQWVSTFIAADMATPPDVYVVRWGLNDPNIGLSDAANAAYTIAAIRSGLATIRASHAWTAMTIILMPPNDVYDDAAGRTQLWQQLVRAGLRQAARDYQCVYADTHQYLQDASVGYWINNDYGGSSGRFVHPLNMGNVLIAGLIAEALMPPGTAYSSGSQIWNVGYPSEVQLSTADISVYPLGISILPAVSANGFPFQGVVTTIKHISTYAMQINQSSDTGGTSGSDYAIRFFNLVAGWSDWSYGQKSSGKALAPAALTLQNSWVAFDGTSVPKYSVQGNRVYLSGLIKNGTFTTGALIATLPVGAVPTRTIFVTVSASPASGVNTYATLVIFTSGQIQVYAVPGNYYLSLDNINFSIV